MESEKDRFLLESIFEDIVYTVIGEWKISSVNTSTQAGQGVSPHNLNFVTLVVKLVRVCQLLLA